MAKVVYNAVHGGFGLSVEAIRWLAAKGNPRALHVMSLSPNPSDWYLYEIERDDPLLVECVETLGDKANEASAKLKITEVPRGYNWDIEEFDGYEKLTAWPRSVLSWR